MSVSDVRFIQWELSHYSKEYMIMAQFQLTVNVLDSFTKKQPLTDAEVIAIEYYKGNQASNIEAEVIEAD